MMTLIIGGSGSGKSEYAENRLLSYAKGQNSYYIATMQIYDEEGQKRRERHRKMREGKGFETIEQPRNIETVTDKIKENSVAILECVSNLVANEMFSEGEIQEEALVEQHIVSGIVQLQKTLHHLVIVSNNVFEDGAEYDETTMAYIRAIGNVNRQIAKMADEVVEVVVGLPIRIK